jgi:ubiquinone/menaquinone biosynthesis C-methylase UbiE
MDGKERVFGRQDMRLEDVKAIYNSTARAYEELVIPCRICQYLMLIEQLNVRGSERILELGSGPGYLSIEMARKFKGSEIIGIDISERMVEIASERAREKELENVRFMVGDVTDLNFPDNSFDVCVNSYLIHWVSDVRRFLGEIRRVLKDRGRLGIIAPSREWYYREIYQAYRRIIREYKQYLADSVSRELVGVRIYSEEELQSLIQTEFEISKSIAFRFRESIPISICLKRISAKTGGILNSLPPALCDEVKQKLMQELAGLSVKLATTEAGHIVIANKRG